MPRGAPRGITVLMAVRRSIGQQSCEIRVRAGDDVGKDQFATQSFDRLTSDVNRRLDGSNVPSDHDRDISGADFFLAGQCDVGSLEHIIGRMQCGDQPCVSKSPSAFVVVMAFSLGLRES